MIKVGYINHMGDDLTVVNAARVSFGSTSDKLTERDEKLIKYLADHEHMSPFEHCQLTVLVECPLYIRSQIQRHRTFAYNEISRRYTDIDMKFYTPDVLRKQHESNRQSSYGALGDQAQEAVKAEIEEHHARGLKLFEDLQSMGVCREQSRGVLSQDLLTKFYMTGSLRNWTHFLKLRLHEGAQFEVQTVANQVKDILLDKFGYSGKVLLEKEK